MRSIDKIIIHCSATPPHKDFSAEDIRDWHVKGNKWSDIGYHYIVKLDGSMEYGRPIEVPGAHCKGHNQDSIGICYIGVICNNFNVSLSFCFCGMGDYSSFSSVIRKMCFNFVDRESVVFMHFLVMYFVM